MIESWLFYFFSWFICFGFLTLLINLIYNFYFKTRFLIWTWIQMTRIYMSRKVILSTLFWFKSSQVIFYSSVQSQNISMRTLGGQSSGWNRVLILICREQFYLMEHLPFCMAAIQSIILKNLRYLKASASLYLFLLATTGLSLVFLCLQWCLLNYNLLSCFCYFSNPLGYAISI